MNPEQFERHTSHCLSRSKQLLTQKNVEYGGEEDRLRNIKTAALITGLKPSLIAWIWQLKHEISKRDIIDGRIPNQEGYRAEKFGDSTNYNIIIEACLIEEEEKAKRKGGPGKIL